MASVNKVILIGNLGRDPEVRFTPSGSAVCNLSLATTRSWKSKESGEKQEETEWHRVVLYDRLAEIAGEYLKKGRPVYIEGRLKTRKWTDKDGAEKYTTEVVAEQLQLMGKGSENENSNSAPQGGAAPAPAPTRSATPPTSAESYRPAAPRPPAPAPSVARSRPAAPVTGGFNDMDDDIPF